MVKVILRKGRDESVRRFHPWVFSGSIAQIQGTPAEGDLVSVYAADGAFLACGHYQIGSIAVRILSFDSDILAPDFWETMISRALAVRISASLAEPPAGFAPECCISDSKASVVGKTNCYRLVQGKETAFLGLLLTTIMVYV